MLWRVGVLPFRNRADKGTRDCVASIHPSMYCVTRGCGVVPEPEGELRSLKELPGLAQILRSLRRRQLSCRPGPARCHRAPFVRLGADAVTFRTTGIAAARSEVSARTTRAVTTRAVGLAMCTAGLRPESRRADGLSTAWETIVARSPTGATICEGSSPASVMASSTMVRQSDRVLANVGRTITAMKKKIIIGFCSAVLGIAFLTGSAFAAPLPHGATTSVIRPPLTAQARIVNRGDQEIVRRVTALNALLSRINAMQKLSADEKSSLSSDIQSQISALTNLRAKIFADENNASNLKADIQSITDLYRIYRLVIPKGAILAAADRAMTIVGSMTTIGAKLQTRVTALGDSASASTTSALADFNAKIADANTQAQAAVSEVSGLVPDQGVQAQLQSNESALKDARSKIQAAQQDFVAARKDAETIVKALAA